MTDKEAGKSARAIVDEQAEDDGLWFEAMTAPEAYLQAALRRLHAAVEGEPHAGGGFVRLRQWDRLSPHTVRITFAGEVTDAQMAALGRWLGGSELPDSGTDWHATAWELWEQIRDGDTEEVLPILAAALESAAQSECPERVPSREVAERLHRELSGLSNQAYCAHIDHMKRPEALGWEAKVKGGTFGEKELYAHTGAAEFLGKHRAYADAALRMGALFTEGHTRGPSRPDCARCKNDITKCDNGPDIGTGKPACAGRFREVHSGGTPK